MTRFFLALRCFFAVLFQSRLSPQTVALLMPLGLPSGQPDLQLPKQDVPPPPKLNEAPPAEVVPPPVSVPVVTPAVAAAAPSLSAAEREAIIHRGAVQLLAVLQREGRLLDFLLEDIDGYGDGQIGAAVRDIHRGCRKALAEHVKIAPIRSEPDEAVVRIAAGHDPSQIRLIGQVTGRPPFEGTLRHHGWRTTQMNLSDIPQGHDPTVICPAEVELGG
jgi:hypothetical protein